MSLRAIEGSNSEDRQDKSQLEPETMNPKESVRSKSIKKSKSKSPTRVKTRRGRAWKQSSTDQEGNDKKIVGLGGLFNNLTNDEPSKIYDHLL